MALYDTALNILSDTAVELGLGAVSDPYGSTDANIVQLRGLLKRVGRNLAKKRAWKQLLKEHTFSTTGTASYNLPADFGAMVDQTGWDRTNDSPLSVVTPQEWQYLQATGTDFALRVLFRTYDLTLKVHPASTTGSTIAFEYLSRYWVAASGGTTGTKDAPTANTDNILFEPDLIVPVLKYAWKKEKGFEASGAFEDAQLAYNDAAGANAGASPVLPLNAEDDCVRFLDMGNAPSTGFGFDGVGGLY